MKTELSCDIHKLILEVIEAHSCKITPSALKKHLGSESRYSGEDIKSAIKYLIADGSLMYTNFFGATYIEKSLRTPLRLSKHVIVKPPEIVFEARKDEVVISLMAGSAFGTGEHPSTHLAVSGLEFVLIKNNSNFIQNRSESRMLDIGIGSGILAITALKMGVDTAVGIDIDPCAIYEAKLNAEVNHLGNRLFVTEHSINTLNDTFDLVTANLRYPTLTKLVKNIRSLCKARGIIILSGIKTDEIPAVCKAYSEKQFHTIWSVHEKGWAGLVLQVKDK